MNGEWCQESREDAVESFCPVLTWLWPAVRGAAALVEGVVLRVAGLQVNVGTDRRAG